MRRATPSGRGKDTLIMTQLKKAKQAEVQVVENLHEGSTVYIEGEPYRVTAVLLPRHTDDYPQE